MLGMRPGWGPRGWVVAVSVPVIIGGSWWLLKAGSQGVNIATVLALPAAAIALVMAFLDKLPGTVPQRDALAGESLRLARAVAQEAAAERNRLFGDGDASPADVSFTRYPGTASAGIYLVRWREDGGAAEGTLAGVSEFYRSLGRGRLVVLGGPGSGKSVLATLLALELAVPVATSQTPADLRVRVPVRLSLPAFDPGYEADHATAPELAKRLKTWIAEHLQQVYSVHPRTAAAPVTEGWIVPVLDGLDEMDREDEDPKRARAVIRALNHPGPDGLPRLVLTCREVRYQRLAKERPGPGRASVLQDATAIGVQPLSSDQVCNYLAARFPHPDGPTPDGAPRADERWQPVLDQVRKPGTDLTRALGSPLNLFLAVTGYYDQRSEPAQLLRLDGSGIQRDLLDRLIPALTARNPCPDGGLHEPHDVARWLTTLSRHLRSQQARGGSGADLYLHQLWLEAAKPSLHYRAAATVALAVAVPQVALALWYVLATGHLVPVDLADRMFSAAGIVSVLVAFCLAVRDAAIPLLLRLDFRGLSVRRIAGAVADGFVNGLALGLILGLASGLLIGLAAGMRGLTFGAAVVFPVAFAYRFAAGVASSLMQEQRSIERPRQLVRQGLAYPIVMMLALGLVSWLGFSLVLGPMSGLAIGFAFAVYVGRGCGVFHSPWPRYALGVRVLTHRRLLPRHPAPFLDWACEVGLMKISGIAIQFRHQSLQAHLINADQPAATSPAQSTPPKTPHSSSTSAA